MATVRLPVSPHTHSLAPTHAPAAPSAPALPGAMPTGMSSTASRRSAGPSLREVLGEQYAQQLQERENVHSGTDTHAQVSWPVSAATIAEPASLEAGTPETTSSARGGRGAWAVRARGRGQGRGRSGPAHTHTHMSDYEAALALQARLDAEEQAAQLAQSLVFGSAPAPAPIAPETAAAPVLGLGTEEEDASLALALQLQEEEYRLASRAASTVLAGTGGGKVRVVAGRAPATAAPAPQRKLYSAEDAEELARETAERNVLDPQLAQERREEATYRRLRGRGPRGRPALTTSSSTGTATAEDGDPSSTAPTTAVRASEEEADADEDPSAGLATKHDAELCGRRAARQLEREFGHITGDLAGVSLSGPATSSLRRHLQKQTAKGGSAFGRVENTTFATQESVLDMRTRMILFKLVSSGRLDAIAGVCRVGKEAAVYRGVGWHEEVHRALAEEGWYGQNNQIWDEDEEEEEEEDDEATTDAEAPAPDDAGVLAHIDLDTAAGGAAAAAASEPDAGPTDPATDDTTTHGAEEDEDVAIKIFKLTLNEFKDRREYVEGDRRFSRLRLTRQNPRKVVTMWATKEFQNLIRIHRAGIPSPAPLALRGHVIVMSFIGTDGWSSPQLRDAPIKTVRGWTDAYVQVVTIMNALYKWCHLVHADLSEYNLLCCDKRVYVIDVGQAVDGSHPHAEEFLLKDATNVTHFFARKGVDVLPVDELIRLVKDDSVLPHPPETGVSYRTGSYASHMPAPGSGVRQHKEEMAAVATSKPFDSLEAAAQARGVAVEGLADGASAPAVEAADDVDPFDGTHGPLATWIRNRLRVLASREDAASV